MGPEKKEIADRLSKIQERALAALTAVVKEFDDVPSKVTWSMFYATLDNQWTTAQERLRDEIDFEQITLLRQYYYQCLRGNADAADLIAEAARARQEG